MTLSVDPTHALTTTFAVDDLTEFCRGDGPFLSVVLPAASEHHDADHRFGVRWQNARRTLEANWSNDALAELDELVDGLDHGAGEAFAIYQRADGETLTAALVGGVHEAVAEVGPAPRLLPVIEDRQRTLPHVVVEADRAGADIIGFDGGAVVATDQIDGDDEHIHRSRGGGWSHRRFQQRAENTWERNADDVVEAVADLAERIGALIVVVAGDVRARTLVADGLDGRVDVETLEDGSPDSIAASTVRLVDTRHAELQRAVLDRLRGSGGITDADEVLSALQEGRVETLLAAPDRHDRADAAGEADPVDRAVVSALGSAAKVIVLPRVPELTDGLAAITRW